MKKFKIMFIAISFVLTFNMATYATEKETPCLNSENNNNSEIKKIEDYFTKTEYLINYKIDELEKYFKKITENEINLINLKPTKLLNKMEWTNEELKNIEKNFIDQKKHTNIIEENLKNFIDSLETEKKNKSYFENESKKKIYESLNEILNTGVISTTAADYTLVFNTLVEIFCNMCKANNTLFHIARLNENLNNKINSILENIFKETLKEQPEETIKILNQTNNLNNKLNSILDKRYTLNSKINIKKHKRFLNLLIHIYNTIFSSCENKFYNAQILVDVDYEKIEKTYIDNPEIVANQLDKTKNISLHNEKNIVNEFMENEYYDLKKTMDEEGLPYENYCFTNNFIYLEHIFESLKDIKNNLNKIKTEINKSYDEFNEIIKNTTNCKNELSSNEIISTNELQLAIYNLIRAYLKKATYEIRNEIPKIYRIVVNAKNKSVLKLMIELHKKICNIMKDEKFKVEDNNKFSVDDVINISNELKAVFEKSVLKTNTSTLRIACVSIKNMLELWGFLVELFLKKNVENEKIKEIQKFIEENKSKFYIDSEDYEEY